MTRIDSFRDLDVWKEAHQLVIDVYQLTRKYPKEELFTLTKQTRKSIASIPTNIAEGKGRRTLGDYIRFLKISRGSVEEVKYHLLLAADLDFIGKEDFSFHYNRLEILGKRINSLINSLSKKQP